MWRREFRIKKQAKPFGFACLIIIFDNELVFFVNLSLSNAVIKTNVAPIDYKVIEL